MRVVVTGATGNAGTSVVKALSESPEIDEIVGLARRKPTLTQAKTSWIEANILNADLAEIFAGADAVIHLAWAIQPSRDAQTLERINVEGSHRVFQAVAAAGVAKLVYASSVGVYSPGPKDREVDESWPTEGTHTSFHSRHKVLVERQLDRFEAENPETQVVRLRPELTDGRGPDSAIDAVGMEAHGAPGAKAAQAITGLLPDAVAAKVTEKAAVDRLSALLACIDTVRRGGTVSISGVYGGQLDPLPMMQIFDKGLQLRMGQPHVRQWTDEILPLLEEDAGDPLGVDDLTTHQLPLDQAPEAYSMFQKKEDRAIKVVLKP